MTQSITSNDGTKLGEMLVCLGLVDQFEVNRCLQIARMHEVPLGNPLVSLGLLEEEDLSIVLCMQGAARAGRLKAQAITGSMSLMCSTRNDGAQS